MWNTNIFRLQGLRRKKESKPNRPIANHSRQRGIKDLDFKNAEDVTSAISNIN